MIAQSQAIARFAGSLSGCYPTTNPLEAAKVDEILSAMEEIADAASPSYYVEDQEIVKNMRLKLEQKVFPHKFGLIEKRIGKTAGPFLLGSKLTIADLSIYVYMRKIKLGYMLYISTTYFDPYQTLWRYIML